MFIEWLTENIFSILILIAVIALLALLCIRVYKEHKLKASSPTPRCCGCPNAKKCAASGSSCAGNQDGAGDKPKES